MNHNKKNPKLEKAENDFGRLNKILKKEDIALKETPRTKTILEYVLKLKYSPNSAMSECYRYYSLDERRHPDVDIIPKVKNLMWEALKNYNLSRG